MIHTSLVTAFRNTQDGKILKQIYGYLYPATIGQQIKICTISMKNFDEPETLFEVVDLSMPDEIAAAGERIFREIGVCPVSVIKSKSKTFDL